MLFRSQYLNSEMLRKYIKRRVAHNPKLFEDAYQQMRDKSKKCYVATYCFSDDDPILITLREFKVLLGKYRLGNFFIDSYYHCSIRLISYIENKKSLKPLFIFSSRRFLYLFSKMLRLARIIR